MTSTLHIYTRVSSTIQQEEGTSLENQKQLGIKKANELGFDFRLWNEGGQSSFHDDLDNRPILVSLLTLIESGVVKHLFVYNTDRLSRNQQTWAVIRYKLLAHGVTLHTVSGQMQLKNPVDDLMLGILSEISQYDNRIRSERSRLGRFQKVQQGNWKGGPPPFGYRLNERRLETDPFESEWVRSMFDWYCHGVSTKEIQARLSRQGVLTRRGNSQWSLGSIQLILRNPVYVGYFDYTDKMVGETVRIQTPPIIDAQLFQNAQDRRRGVLERRGPRGTTKHFYLLRGVLFCGHCGSPMGGRTHKAGHQHVYYCVKKERDWKNRGENHPKWKRGTGCTMVRSVNIERTDQLVWNMIKEALRQIRERSPTSSVSVDLAHPQVNEASQSPSAGFTHLSPDHLDNLSNAEKRSVIDQLISRITVHLDTTSNKHCITCEFTETVSGLLASISDPEDPSHEDGIPASGSSDPLSDPEQDSQGETVAKKSGGSRDLSAAETDWSVTVE